MADEVDRANDFIYDEVSRVLAERRNSATGKPGPKTCVECDERIPDARRKLGFTLCVPCAQEHERRESLFAS